ncbi:tetrapyrrole methylase family protein/MazG family protein/ATP diphosphatase [Geothermobacter ehrlichii]|uniref:Tetrapyrrole methylase family protein/MazG family protein/ATP diphosphatase n=1 Tax=Geothermobacter ehrlichii TaxID=213224 RepID=A0A5D3WPU7_9BACT|nr:nucleoside triphosphate pyrophosphohydrolase [Geothermobacter ehrlichii]TYP00247.1 tetrapyrrole methylase family protein/MazG family protein/ATP diphosphatase [Geothermobacter ehrlichii]
MPRLSELEASKSPGDAFERLCDIMHRLRGPGGCPWDARQTPESLKPHILEEAYEVIEAIDLKDNDKICEELGDLLLQVVFQAEIFRQQEAFDATVVADSIADKLVRRHPHVFADADWSCEKELHLQWERIKSKEKPKRGTQGPFDTIPNTLPALMQAQKLVSKAMKSDLEQDRRKTILVRMSDRLAALPPTDAEPEGAEELIGELLLEVVRLAASLGCDAETSLLRTMNAYRQQLNAAIGQGNNSGNFSSANRK